MQNAFVQRLSQRRYSGMMNSLPDIEEDGLPRRFVIFNFPRSGSNLLCSMLNQHPDILCHHEVFNPQKIYYAKNFHELLGGGEQPLPRLDLIDGKVGIGSKWERNTSPERFMLKLWQHSYEAKAVGFNLFPTHIPNAATSIIKDDNIQKILLVRRNKVKCYVSRAIARKTGVWDLYGNKLNGPKISVTINPKRLLAWSYGYDRYFEKMRQHLAASNQSYLDLIYEEIVGKDSSVVKTEMLKFIGVSPDIHDLQPPLKKQNSNQLCELVSNFTQLKKALAGTELEAFV